MMNIGYFFQFMEISLLNHYKNVQITTKISMQSAKNSTINSLINSGNHQKSKPFNAFSPPEEAPSEADSQFYYTVIRVFKS